MSAGRSQRGFTLIEMTVAIGIMVVLFSAVILGVGAITGSKAKSAAGELGGVIRSLYDTAALSGRTCRLVFQLPGEKEEGGRAKYWAECAAGGVTTSRDRDEQLRDQNRVLEEQAKQAASGRRSEERASSSSLSSYSTSSGPGLSELMAREKDRVDSSARYSDYTNPEIAPRQLPASVRLGVWTRHQREAAKSGMAYLYFFPQGFTEKALVYVSQGDNTWTISVAPLTGKTTVVGEELEVPKS